MFVIYPNILFRLQKFEFTAEGIIKRALANLKFYEGKPGLESALRVAF